MDLQKLCGALRRGSVDAHRCLGCGCEHNCSIHGCQIMKEAADLLEELAQEVSVLKSECTVHIMRRNAEKQRAFRLGQLAMKESVILMLKDVASRLPRSIVRVAVLMAAAMVEDMEVP